jgi:hypothetical protein
MHDNGFLKYKVTKIHPPKKKLWPNYIETNIGLVYGIAFGINNGIKYHNAPVSNVQIFPISHYITLGIKFQIFCVPLMCK